MQQVLSDLIKVLYITSIIFRLAEREMFLSSIYISLDRAATQRMFVLYPLNDCPVGICLVDGMRPYTGPHHLALV